ncbi:GntR family transcriptional regulator [Roseinatronobacter alkalisoli]|uniref:GntR family transcriptional regulator n=1 Tax=Roseinatronobacter alkalisoli TaxID=3028235 RepID=A0ABT5TCT1_9RHOB|nr:GntR family transcriptional regulator [Roseinatronobacter sp. HJB301]MDD7972930.1 GntR family transcriptional regulator [Roseinatronobacter sp. HJB301]
MNNSHRSNLRQTTYEAIKMLIITGQLSPGSRVSEADLANRLEVSRTPVREALSRLEHDGFVLPRPRNGYSVMRIDIDTVNEAYDVRDVLEAEATKLATKAIDDAGRAELRAIIDECDRLAALPDRTMQDDLREMQIGIDLHRIIARHSGNSLLCSLLDGVLDRCQAYVWLDVTNLNSFAAARDDHRAIVDAVCRGDVDAAVELTCRHMSEARENVLSVVRLRRSFHDIMSSTG